ncbi:hypothetical protein NLG97_g10477 [Lecanicillium saksenae]|uniref:Uncharacterized protein n=1 Tax=Lecanicillium saksenae TaxID=468837 RepID=A0ACC1QEW9_9HYPO|nr:hypothetical protein NLG97_g10477 [Lecanicillium saksenae]
MVGLVTVMAIFHEAGNGANFALVPHVHPAANGVVSGVTGAGGNLGGVVFAIVFRFMDGGKGYAKAFWVIGVMHIALNLAVCWIPPLPKGQVGGRSFYDTARIDNFWRSFEYVNWRLQYNMQRVSDAITKLWIVSASPYA